MNIEKWENLCYNLYSIADFAKDGEEYVKFFDDDSPFSPWNNAFKRDGSYLVCDETCYFGINYYDVLLPVDEVDDIKNQLEKRRDELCLM